MRREKGITLVALVVTVIILLILVSVTLSMLTGENGIIAKAREAKEKTEIAAWEEKIDLAIVEAEGEKKNPTLEDVIDKLYDNDIIDDKENDVNRETGAITTNEPEYVIEGKLDDYLDNQGSTEPEEPPVYEEGDIIFSYNPQEMTNKDVEVTITKNVEENYTIEYSKYDTNNWEEYVSPVIMEKNGAIYARLKNNAGVSNYATGNVTNIDKLPPNEPTIQIGEVTENSITVTASSTDKTATSEYANSGIKGYQFSKDNGESWEPEIIQASGSYKFTGLTEDTTYNIKVKAIDNAENETISASAISQKTESGGITAGDIANGDGSIFGSEVKGYECTNSAAVNKWLIFYVGTMGDSTISNIYLISDDYIEYDYIPTNSKGNKPLQDPNENLLRGAGFKNIVEDYEGANNITSTKLKLLNNDYFNKYTTSERHQYNMKSVAYMLDVETWSNFAGNNAEYAIGGPTLELLLKSYNEKYNKEYIAQAIDKKGYQVKENNYSSWQYNILNAFDIKDLTYVVSSNQNANFMWIASPSAMGFDRMICVSNEGGLSFVTYYSGQGGFRPIVCLKSNVELQDNGDGTYTIK